MTMGAISKVLLVPLALLLSPQEGSAVQHLSLWGHYLMIQDDGHLKPFDAFAQETVTFVTGSPRVKWANPVSVVLSIIADPDRWRDEPLIWVQSAPVRRLLGLRLRQSHASVREIMATQTFFRMLLSIVKKQQRNEPVTGLEQAALDVYERFAALNALLNQELRLVPPPSGRAPEWLSILNPESYPWEQQAAIKRVWGSFLEELREENPARTTAAGQQLLVLLRHLNPPVYSVSAQASWPLSDPEGWDLFSHSFPAVSGSASAQ